MTTCTCCGQTDGVTEHGVEGVAVDESSGLCLHCQPCPWCGRMGTGCQSEHGGIACDPNPSPDGTPRPPYAERQEMRW